MLENKLGSKTDKQIVQIESNGTAYLHEFAPISSGHTFALFILGENLVISHFLTIFLRRFFVYLLAINEMYTP